MSTNLTNDQWRQEYSKLYKEYEPKLALIKKEISTKAEAAGMDGFEVSGLIFEKDPKPIG